MSDAPEALEVLIRKLESTLILAEEERQAIRRLPTTIRFIVPGQDLVEDGGRIAHCGLLLEGWSYRYKLFAEGRRQILSFHIAGDMPDLQSFLLSTLDHGVAALTPCTFALIPHESLRRLIITFPNVATLLWRQTLVDTVLFQTWIAAMGRRSAYARIAHLFCELYLRQEAAGLAADLRCSMPLRQTDLADMAGLTSVHVNRVLKALRSDSLIIFKNRHLLIQDWQRLSDAAEFNPAYLHLNDFKG